MPPKKVFIVEMYFLIKNVNIIFVKLKLYKYSEFNLYHNVT